MWPVVALLAVSAITSLASSQEQKKARKAQQRGQEEANRASKAATDIRNNEARRQAERRKEIRLAQLRAITAASGTVGSSGFLGAVSAFQTNTALGAAAQEGFNNAITAQQNIQQETANKVGGYLNRAATWSTIGTLAQMGASAASAGGGSS